MASLKKSIMISLLIILLVAVVACPTKKKDTKTKTEELRSGAEGLKIRFLPNNPPATIIVGKNIQNNKVDLVLEVVNKGVYPQPEDTKVINGKVYLSGYDKNIIDFQQPSYDLSKSQSLYGKTLINTEGGTETITFTGDVILESLKVDKYEPIFLATLCYEYHTIAGPSVCIDPDPYPQVKQKKVCEVKDITLTSQGAPIAVTKITEKALSDRTQFTITVKNVGLGDVLRTGAEQTSAQGQQQSGTSIEKCDPFGSNKLAREDIDKVHVDSITIGDQFLQCVPFSDKPGKADAGDIRLQNGEGTIICEFPKDYSTGVSSYSGGNTAYTTPLKVELSYGYKTTAEAKTLLKKEDTGE
ncbi:hypothetical protein HY637_04030 [Candidatus Woesearchaeota archaeon]|nr:hypothetical protein [Candidatus Woesearchaeota archaeon]